MRVRPRTNMFFVETDETKKWDNVFTMRWKLDDGCLVELSFCDYEFENPNNAVYYTTLFIGKRKKGFQENMVTGKGTLEGLHIALFFMKEFINSIRDKDKIVVEWTDARREKMYKRFLKPLGFAEGNYENKPVLIFTKHEKMDS